MMMNHPLPQCLLTFFAAILVSMLPVGGGNAANVVATVKPIHSLVAGVMEGVGEPHLIVDGSASPHMYSLRPSNAVALREAEIVFWVGPNLETFLAAPLKAIAGDATIMALGAVPGVETLPLREGGAFEVDDHENHGHETQQVAGHEAEHDDAQDAHIWLDPHNAKAMVRAIAEALIVVDPDNSDTYRANVVAMSGRLDALVADIDAEVASVRGRAFVVFHDAYHYFERRFRIEAAGSITVSPDVLPGARRLTEIRDKMRSLDAACVFSEPQFEPRLIGVVTEGSTARTGILDPLGSALLPGPELYEALIRNMAAALTDCLAAQR